MNKAIFKWCFIGSAMLASAMPALAASKPKLVVMVVIDQGRYDYPLKRPTGYGPPPGGSAGYQTFLKQGAVFTNTCYAHSVTVTEPGHMTLVTGGNPDTHGIPRNNWLDRASGSFVNDIFDSNYRILGNTQLKPSGKPGTAPTALLENTGTLGDRLVQATDGKAKVFSLGIWDWPIIPMAGGGGKAFWYDYTSGEFVSSTFFYSELPRWVQHWNKTNPLERYLDQHMPRDPKTGYWVWKPLNELNEYRNVKTSPINAAFVKPPCYPGQTNCQYSLGATFPHMLPNGTPEALQMTKLLVGYTPFSDDFLIDFVAKLVQEERLGQDATPDLLMMSLPATDMIGHMYGPDSLEHEDNFYRLDKTLARLLDALKQAVPQEDLLVVLSADHGMNSIPEFLQQQGKASDIGRLENGKILWHVNSALVRTFGAGRLAIGLRPPSLFLDLAKIKQKGLNPNKVAQKAAEVLRGMNGIRYAWTKQELLARKFELNNLERKRKLSCGLDPKRKKIYMARMLKSIDQTGNTNRSGEVFIVQDRYWYFHELETDAAMHGSPYNFSRRVQLMFWGGPIKQARVKRRVEPRDIVPTLARILGVKPPKASTGIPIKEIVKMYTPVEE